MDTSSSSTTRRRPRCRTQRSAHARSSLLGPLDRRRRGRLGDRPAVPPDPAAPARPGLLVARGRAAAARRRGGHLLRARRSRGRSLADLEERRWSLRAEIVHWLFATGVLLLGLIMLAEAIVGPRGLAARGPGGVYLWPGIAFGLGDPDVAGDDLLHQLGDPHGRPRRLGPGADGDGRRRARAREGEAAQPLVEARGADRDRRLGRGVPRARAEPVVLRPLGVPAPPDRLDAARRGALPARPRLPAPLGRPARGLRDRASSRSR